MPDCFCHLDKTYGIINTANDMLSNQYASSLGMYPKRHSIVSFREEISSKIFGARIAVFSMNRTTISQPILAVIERPRERT